MSRPGPAPSAGVPGTSSAPVFVVGTPRSGTTLVAAMLDAHPRLDCGPESRFFARYRHLGASQRAALVDPAGWPGPGTHFVCSLENQGHPVHALFGLGRDDIRAWLGSRPPSVQALLESLTAQRAERDGKPRWVEKTPRHLASLDLIRELWPDAFVIRIVRDPRDVALSLARMPFASDSVVNGLLWAEEDERFAGPRLADDPRALTLRYEDLIADPERELRRICALIGEGFEPRMLERRSDGVGVVAAHEWWKRDAGAPLDPSRAGRWRATMDPATQRFAAVHLAGLLRTHGYEGALEATSELAIVPPGAALGRRDEALLLALAARDVAVVRPVPATTAALAQAPSLLLFGIRGQLDPFRGQPPAAHVTSIARFAALLLRRRLSGRPVPWMRRRSLRDRRPGDPGELAVLLLARSLARPVDVDAVPDLAATPAPDLGRGELG